MGTVIWPKVFTDLDFLYPADNTGLAMAVADGLTGWGCCMMGATPPLDFGQSMVKIAQRIKSSASPENLMLLADEIKFNS